MNIASPRDEASMIVMRLMSLIHNPDFYGNVH